MDKIKKALRKLSAKEQGQVARVIKKLISMNWAGLDIVKLKGTPDIFRVRAGQIRIIFRYRSNQIAVLAIDRRSEKTYRNF